MIYSKLVVKLHNKESRFRLHSDYKQYRVLNVNDFSKLSMLVNKIKGATLKVRDCGEICISIYNEKAIDYFYLEAQNKEIISIYNV